MGDIKVSASHWAGLSGGDRSRIEAILNKNRLIQADDRIVPTPNVAMPEAGASEGGLCSVLCGVAEAAATQECNKLDGIAKDICLAATKAAGDLCRSKC